jgi:hypothetical protein
MSTNKVVRYSIFNKFSKNLEYVKNNNGVIAFVPDFTDGYICPICLEAFFEKDLSIDSPKYLTLEHVPPASLGGKGIILTCNNCNSNSGSYLDSALLKHLEELDLKSFLPNSKITAGLEINGNKINGRIIVDKDGQVNMHLDKERSNPSAFNKVLSDLSPTRMTFDMFSNYNCKSYDRKLPARISFFNQPKKRMIEIALLRIAYLLSYSTFGNSVIANHGTHYLREQIRFPEKNILEPPFRLNFEFPEQMLGMNMIKEPKELRSFLIIFNLKTKSTKRQFAVLLPGPSEPIIDVYKNLDKILINEANDDSLPCELEHIPSLDFVGDTKLALGYHYFWQKFAKD